jgi:hypothetical protein
MNGIVTLESGLPLSMSANNTAGLFGARTQPNSAGRSGKKTGRVQDRLDAYFDRTAYLQPAPFTFGNLSRFLPDIRNHGVNNWDLSFFKQFQIREKYNLQFRSEFFNAFNRARFGGPNTSVTSNQAGVITSQANIPRQIQFALKLLW